MRRHVWIVIVGCFITCASGIAAAAAQRQATSERISFKAATARDGGVSVQGELRIPQGVEERLPAVLVLHTAGGIDATGRFYIEALNAAGIATLEIEMFPDRTKLPQTTRVVMPHTFGSLLYLADHPRIDPRRIGVIGFSYGGIMSLLMTSKDVTQEYTGGKAQFAAHVAIYPVCWIHQQILAGKNRVYGPDTYRSVTGAPAHILTGDRDDYDDPDSCPKFVAALPETARPHYAATVYKGAYHGFDEPGADRKSQDRVANLGRGGTVIHKANPEVAARARAFAVDFFSTHLGVKK
jgi:dienelactone hydrolase